MILLLLKQGMEEGKKGNRVIETYSYSTVYCAEKNENCDVFHIFHTVTVPQGKCTTG